MDHRLHELTWALKRLQLMVDRALETVRPLRQARDTMLRELLAQLSASERQDLRFVLFSRAEVETEPMELFITDLGL